MRNIKEGIDIYDKNLLAYVLCYVWMLGIFVQVIKIGVRICSSMFQLVFNSLYLLLLCGIYEVFGITLHDDWWLYETQSWCAFIYLVKF